MSDDEELDAEILEAEITEASEERIKQRSNQLQSEIHQLQAQHNQQTDLLKQEIEILRQDNSKLRGRLQYLGENFFDVTRSLQNLQKLLKQLKTNKLELEKQLSQAEWRVCVYSQNAAKAIQAKRKDVAIKEIMRETIQKNLVEILKSQLEQQNLILENLESNLETFEKFVKKM